jgi:hypothetical protein
MRWLVVDGDGGEEGRGCQRWMATKMTAVAVAALCSRRLIFSLPDAASLFSALELGNDTKVSY